MNKLLILVMSIILVCSCVVTKIRVIKGSYTLLERSEVETSQVIGFLKDKKTGEVAPFATIYITGHNIATSADKRGFFKVKVPSGKIQMKISSVGHTDLKTEYLNIKPKEQLKIYFYLGTTWTACR